MAEGLGGPYLGRSRQILNGSYQLAPNLLSVTPVTSGAAPGQSRG